MKKLYPLLFIAFLFCGKTYSQFTMPTVADIYDFAVGDTFMYQAGSSDGFSQSSMVVITSRINYNDSIVYDGRVQYKTSSILSPVQIFHEIILHPGDVYYAYWLGFADSVGYEIPVAGDTVYSATGGTLDYCSLGGNQVQSVVDLLYKGRKGLGMTYSYYSFRECYRAAGKSLMYAHKTNGRIYGAPLDFIVGINEVAEGKVARLFPNPSSSNFQIQLQELPAAKTYLQIFDGLGRVVKKLEIISLSTTVERANLSNGIYYWQVTIDGNILEQGKLVIQ